MYLKLISRFVVVIVLAVLVSKTAISKPSVQQELPIIIKQLQVGNGVIPISIQCEGAIVSNANTLDSFSCFLVNNTNKNALAASVVYSVISEINGKEEKDTRLQVMDTLLHPDLLGATRPIQPGGRKFIQSSGPIPEEGAIKRLEIELSYVEFADRTILGIPGKGAEKIANMRRGAANYKNWIKQEYERRGKSAQAILPLLEESTPFSNDIGISNPDQEFGARSYRRRLREKAMRNELPLIDDILKNNFSQ